jgi:DNA-binding FadR family transcriptional regulator
LTAELKNTLRLKTEHALRERILDDSMKVGDKLPTEKALASEYGVSRTVIREAVIALRADGLVESKQGVGIFISERPGPEVPHQAAENVGFPSFLIDLLELRMAIEVQAAGLAAARRSWAQEARIWEAADLFQAALERRQPTEQADWAFHRSISVATNNTAFLEFFDRMGLSIIPRTALAEARIGKLITGEYLEKASEEHREICRAIARQEVEAAREALKNHLGRSRLRYLSLIKKEKISSRTN